MWANEWPLLVGPTAGDLHLWGVRITFCPKPKIPGPFIRQPDALAGLVWEKETSAGHLILFGLVQLAGKEWQERERRLRTTWTFVEPVVLIERWEGTPGSYNDPLDRLAAEMLREYRLEILGKKTTGRPRGAREWSEETFRLLYPEAYKIAKKNKDSDARVMKRLPSQLDVANTLGMSDKTFRHYLRLYNESWPPKIVTP